MPLKRSPDPLPRPEPEPEPVRLEKRSPDPGPGMRPKPGRPALRDIKVMKDDAAAVEKESEEIKKRYVQYFKV